MQSFSRMEQDESIPEHLPWAQIGEKDEDLNEVIRTYILHERVSLFHTLRLCHYSLYPIEILSKAYWKPIHHTNNSLASSSHTPSLAFPHHELAWD